MKNEATIAFVREHRDSDVHALALKVRRDGDVDLPWALDQIQGWQTARRKLPSWASTDGIVYPPHLSMEQCSSEQTAEYKCGIVERLPQQCRGLLMDLTGGFGVDFAFMSRCFNRAVYVERQDVLCDIAQHNFSVLGLDHVSILHADAVGALKDLAADPTTTFFYLDPARRDSNKARTYAIADCSPNVLELQDSLFKAGRYVLVKLSPMLDWHKAVSDLGKRVAEVHIVSVGNECKELLLLMSANHDGEPTIYCVNDDRSLIYMPSQDTIVPALAAEDKPTYLYEPNASIMKAGCFGVLTQHYPVAALAIDSHLFVSNEEVKDFPGRRFTVTAVSRMNKKDLAIALKGITRANIAVRNFPISAQELRKRLHIADGGDCYIFGTTSANGDHLLFLCHKL